MLNFFKKKEESIIQNIIIISKIETNKTISFKIDAKLFHVNWGDSEKTYIQTSHTYEKMGEYKIVITGIYITEFYATNCEISELEFINCTDLYILECSFNQLKKLNLSKCISLENIQCNDNKIKTLELGNLKYLATLDCSYNQIECLNLKKAYNLNHLNFKSNIINKLHLGNAPYLFRLKCSNNPITLKEINKNLPKKIRIFSRFILTIDERQENPKIEKKIIKKNWDIEKESDY